MRARALEVRAYTTSSRMQQAPVGLMGSTELLEVVVHVLALLSYITLVSRDSDHLVEKRLLPSAASMEFRRSLALSSAAFTSRNRSHWSARGATSHSPVETFPLDGFHVSQLYGSDLS